MTNQLTTDASHARPNKVHHKWDRRNPPAIESIVRHALRDREVPQSVTPAAGIRAGPVDLRSCIRWPAD